MQFNIKTLFIVSQIYSNLFGDLLPDHAIQHNIMIVVFQIYSNLFGNLPLQPEITHAEAIMQSVA